MGNKQMILHHGKQQIRFCSDQSHRCFTRGNMKHRTILNLDPFDHQTLIDTLIDLDPSHQLVDSMAD